MNRKQHRSIKCKVGKKGAKGLKKISGEALEV